MTDSPATLTRSQRSLIRAHEHVAGVATRYPLENDKAPDLSVAQREDVKRRNAPNERKRKNYGSLCHSFPVLVRHSGLIQAISFYEAKGAGEGPSSEAYQLILPHIADILEPRPGDTRHTAQSANGLALRTAQLALDRYMIASRQLLDGWTNYKRFAESILKVTSAAEGEGE